jgi:hypothetical protein
MQKKKQLNYQTPQTIKITLLWTSFFQVNYQIPRVSVWTSFFSLFIFVCTNWRRAVEGVRDDSKKSERVMGNLTLVYARELAVTYQSRNWRKRIGTSLADRSRVELALLPRLSLTRSRRTWSLFLFGGSFVLHSLAPQGAQQGGKWSNRMLIENMKHSSASTTKIGKIRHQCIYTKKNLTAYRAEQVIVN